ncbi:MAG TPA: potassium transporter TrkG [Promineifilum sp.]|nr:potassium transporter TrkG [Promineifilum sp.]
MKPPPRGRADLVELAQEGLSLQRKRAVGIPLRLVTALATLVVIGTLLLLLPPMTTQPIGFMDALFTATSAAAVTGLTVVTTGVAFTRLGQWVILFLMQFGGLGFVVTVVLTLRLLGRQVSLIDRLAVTSSFGLAGPRAVLQILGRTVLVMLALETIGTLILWLHWRNSGIVPPDEALFYALFHSVAAFCNAGFDLFSGLPMYPDGLPADTITLLTLGLLIILGGLGIPVYRAVLPRRSTGDLRRRRLSLHTRLALWSALALILVGWVGLLAAEYRHGGVLTDLSFGERTLRAWFQSVAARTAGFAGLTDFGEISEASRLLLTGLMFIGSAPASMGGGITTGTLAVLVAATWNLNRGHKSVRVGDRAISMATVWRATTVLIVSLVVVFVATWLLLISQAQDFSSTLFEVVSAYSTTGLSVGLTSQLNPFGRLVIIAMMFWGRLGAITIMLVLLRRSGRETLVGYPEETVLVG